MSILIIAVIFGLWFTFFATQNSVPVSLQFGGYAVAGVPLYAIALGSLLVGLLISWVINMLEGASSFFKIASKDHSLHKMDDELDKLKAKIQELEVENAELKGKKEVVE